MARKQKPEIVSQELEAIIVKSEVGNQKAVGLVEGLRKLPRPNYSVILVILLVAAAFLIGRLSAQVEYLKGGGNVTALPTAAPQAVAPGQPEASKIDVSGLKKLAGDLRLNQGKFDSCLDSGKYDKKVKDDLAYAGTVGVSGTPTFFVNGVILVGAQPQSEFEKVIDAELKDGSGDKVSGASVGEAPARVSLKSGGYVLGNKNARIKLVEFSDFECPFCTRAFPTVEAILKKYGDRISLEYRHNPLPFHPNAQKAAEASECAGEQGKFWEMHDAIFKIQGA